MGNAIPDIPRIYTALAEWLSCGMFILLLGPKIKKLQFAIASALYFILLAFFLEITATITLLLWIPCMLVAFFSMAGFICLCSKASFFDSIYYAVLAFSVAEGIASLEWQVVNSVFQGLDSIPTYFEIIILVVVYGAILVGLGYLFKLRLPVDKRLKIELKDMITSIFIGLIVFFFSNLSFMTSETAVAGQYSREIANVRTLVDIAGIAILYAHFVSCRNNTVKQELDAVQNALRNQYKQYQQSRESIDIINIKYHDLKHQINMLRELNDREQRDAFLDRMEADIKAYELQNKTGNSVLDTLLTGKSIFCNNHGITMTVVADGTLLDFMDAMDICSIFGNALDNAIESVMKTEEKEKRLIHLTVSKVKAFVMIRVQNYFEGNLKSVEGDIVTTKKDKRLHGYGIKSIKYTAGRYDGVVNIRTDNAWFDLQILIPYNKK